MILSYNLQFFADGPGGEKTEDPTEKKMKDARKDGQVAKSKEVGNAVGLMALFLLIKVAIGYIGNGLIDYFSTVYNEIPSIVKMYDGQLQSTTFLSVFRNMILQMLLLMAPALLVGLVVAFVCDLVQVKWKPTTKPLKPKFSKLNPIKGFSKIFSKNSLMELVKSLLKLGVIGYVAYSYLVDEVWKLYILYEVGLNQALLLIGDILTGVGIQIAGVYMIIALADFAYQKWKHKKDLKMTKQEIKEEYKNQEGDPQVKGKQKQRMQEASRRRMMQQLPEADVVITNPTHYAVAVKYDPDNYDAPVVLAKGEDYLALKIKEIAKENKIEIVENKPLARMLYANVDVGGLVPPELYQAVAEVLAMVYRMQGKV